MADVNDRASRIDDPTSQFESVLAPDVGGAPGPEFDPLSDVLRSVRLAGALFFVWETSSPFATPVPGGERFAPVLLLGAQQIVSYHVVVEGSCWGGLIGGEPVRLRVGDVLLIPRGDAYVMADSEASCRGARVDVGLAVEFFRQMASGDLPFVVRDGGGGLERARIVCGFLGCDVRPFNPIAEALPALVRLTPPVGAGGDRVRALADYAVAEARLPRPGSGDVLARLGELMFVEAIRRCVIELSDVPQGWLAGLRDPAIRRCLALMHRRPEVRWTLEDLARAVGISRSGLAQRFVGRIGTTPMEYLARWRVQIAANLLGETDATVEAVAARVGYGSAPALSRAFKRAVGVSPTQWRREGS